jgi:hypothetical protein
VDVRRRDREPDRRTPARDGARSLGVVAGDWRTGEFTHTGAASGGYASFGRDEAKLEFTLFSTTIDETGYCYAV